MKEAVFGHTFVKGYINQLALEGSCFCLRIYIIICKYLGCILHLELGKQDPHNIQVYLAIGVHKEFKNQIIWSSSSKVR